LSEELGRAIKTLTWIVKVTNFKSTGGGEIMTSRLSNASAKAKIGRASYCLTKRKELMPLATLTSRLLITSWLRSIANLPRTKVTLAPSGSTHLQPLLKPSRKKLKRKPNLLLWRKKIQHLKVLSASKKLHKTLQTIHWSWPVIKSPMWTEDTNTMDMRMTSQNGLRLAKIREYSGQVFFGIAIVMKKVPGRQLTHLFHLSLDTQRTKVQVTSKWLTYMPLTRLKSLKPNRKKLNRKPSLRKSILLEGEPGRAMKIYR
jgi:hypothetical protein